MALTDVFTYNQHFVAMMNVINAARLNPPESGHKHHIVPRCWFKMKNLPIDNSNDNLVLLTYEDHCKVHKLAYLCTTGKMKRNMAYAYHRLTGGELVTVNALKGVNCAIYGRRKWSNGSLGMHWYNNGKVNKFAYECPEGFVKGRLKNG